MRHRPHVVVALGALLALLILTAGNSLAQDPATNDDDNFLLRVGGEAAVGADETIGSVVVVDGDAVVDGRVTQALVVTNGTATVNGQVDGQVMVFNGTLQLASGSTVNDVSVVRGQLERADGATVTGELNDRVDLNTLGWSAVIFTFVLWIGITIVVLLAGLAFAAFGHRQLVDAAQALTGHAGESILTALIVWVGLCLLAILAFVTVIGIPLGLTILLVLLPLLWCLGYIVVGQALGAWLWRLLGQPPHRYLAVLIGLIALQLITLVPAIGGPVGFLAGLVGAGALGYRLYRGRTAPRQPAPPAPALATP